jgi:hypothetical protein
MNMADASSSIVTTTATSMSTAGGAGVIEWLWQGAHSPMPESVALTLAALAAPLVHAGYRWASARIAAAPAAPVAQ